MKDVAFVIGAYLILCAIAASPFFIHGWLRQRRERRARREGR